MPAPLPARHVSPPTADRLMPLGFGMIVHPVPAGRVMGVAGLPTPQHGSLIFGHVFTFGWLAGGWLTVNRGRKGLRRTHRGTEDADDFQAH